MRKNFISWCRSVRCLSEETCNHYGNITSLFDDYCKMVGVSIHEFSETDVNLWIIYQSNAGVKAVTINNRVSCLRMMYDYACRFEGYASNPFVAVQKLKVPKLLPKFIEDATIIRAIQECVGDGFYEVRARAVVAFLYMTGVRRAELENILVSDIMLDAGLVRIFGKGRKERMCPLPAALLPYLRVWESSRDGMLPHPSQYYFCSSVGKPLTHTVVAEIVRAIFLPWVPRKYAHPHILRHSFATRLMRAGVPIVDISRLLGHASTATTLRYLSLAPDTQYSSMLNAIF